MDRRATRSISSIGRRDTASGTAVSSNSAAANSWRPPSVTRRRRGLGSANSWAKCSGAMARSISSKPCSCFRRGVTAGSSARLARDRIEADLVRHLQRVEITLLAIVIRQAGLAREIGAGIADFLAERRSHRRVDCAALAKRARHIEEKADRIAMEARGEIARLDADRSIERLVNQIEDAIDELEQAAFVATLIPAELASELIDPLDELCVAVVSGTEAAAVGIAAAAEVPEGHRVDSEDALAAVGRLIEAEHRADAAERKVTANILTGGFDLKTALSVIELARALERATDRLAAFGHVLREHVLADLSK